MDNDGLVWKEASMGCETIGSEMFDTYIEKSNVVVIDLREKMEYNKMHIKSAMSVSVNEMKVILASTEYGILHIGKQWYGRDAVFLLYCERGSKSMFVCNMMRRQGYQAKTLIGGLTHYHGKYLLTSDMF